MQEAFQEADLKFAHRNVTDSLPPEVEKSLAHADAETRQKILEAGAAAAGAAIQAEEEEKVRKKKRDPALKTPSTDESAYEAAALYAVGCTGES